MNILFVCSGNSFFNINPIIQTQAESVRKKSIKIDFFTVKGKGIKGYINSLHGLKKYLNGRHYDILHAHYGLCGLISQYARKDQKIIVSFMGSDLIGDINSKGKYSIPSRIYVAINQWYAKRKYDAVITKSQQLRNVLKDTSRVYLIPNGVDLNIFYPLDMYGAREKMNIPRDKKIILFVSDPTRNEKNYPLAKAALALLRDNSVELLCLYNKTQQDLNYYYNAVNALLLTSYHEGSPNVIKEAMACNLPIISTDVGDVREIAGDISGCYIARRDPVDVADKIKQALEFSGKTKGRDRLLQLGLDSESIANKLVMIYDDLLK